MKRVEYHNPPGVAAEVVFTTQDVVTRIHIPEGKDYFEILDHVQRRMFKKLHHEGWKKLEAIWKAREKEAKT